MSENVCKSRIWTSLESTNFSFLHISVNLRCKKKIFWSYSDLILKDKSVFREPCGLWFIICFLSFYVPIHLTFFSQQQPHSQLSRALFSRLIYRQSPLPQWPRGGHNYFSILRKLYENYFLDFIIFKDSKGPKLC